MRTIKSLQKLATLCGFVLICFSCQDDRLKFPGPTSSPVTTTTPTTTTNDIWATPTVLSFTPKATTAQVTISTSVPGLNWNVAQKPVWVNVSPTFGNSTAVINVTALTANMPLGKITDKITIVSPSKTIEITVTLDITASTDVVTSANLLNGLVIDAEYDRVADKLYVVTTGNKLLQLSSAGQVLKTLSLPTAPTCISVGRNGQKAVVGHDAWISVIDLATMTIDITHPISCSALDVVLAPNSWAYVFPTRDQWTTIRCIDLQTGAELQHTGQAIYAGTKAKLHPSGDYIYGANNGLSPNDAEKYDIRGGQAIRMYDSPYHGDYNFGGELWMADDGGRMFTRGRTSFRLTTSQSTDMRYAGTIPGSNPPPQITESIKAMDHISSTNRIGAVFFDYGGTAAMNLIHFFTGDFLNPLDTQPLPDFLLTAPNGTLQVPSEGHYGFFNSAGTKFIVLLKSKTTSGVTDQWGVTIVTVN